MITKVIENIARREPSKHTILVLATLFHPLKCGKILNNLLKVQQTCWQVLQNELDTGTHENSLKFQYGEIFDLLIINFKICLDSFSRKQIGLTSSSFFFLTGILHIDKKSFLLWYGHFAVQRKFNDNREKLLQNLQ